MAAMFQDIRYGVRILIKTPAFTVVAILALALGIGANTAIFSVVNGVLLRPLPFEDPDSLVAVREMKLPTFPEFSVAPGNFLEWKKQNTVFEYIGAYNGASYNLIGQGEPERLIGAKMTSGLVSMLGVKPILGREFFAEEDQPEKDKVAIIGEGLWKRRYGESASVVGQSVTLGGETCTIIGVMPAGFKFPNREVEVWRPMAFTAKDAENHGGHYVNSIARLKDGVSLEQALAEMKTIASRLEQQFPGSNTGWSVKMDGMLNYTVSDVKPALFVLLGAVGLVLLIACANVANLTLARAVSRQREIAIRTALGAGRMRIVRQLLTESMVLALLGGGVGLLLAVWGVELLLALAPKDLPRMQDVSIDGRVMLFTLGVALLTGIIFGLAPSLQVSKPNLNESLKEGGRDAGSGRRQRIRNMLVVSEIAIALVLLVGAGLMIKSFLRLQKVTTGFNPQNLLVGRINLPRTKYPENDQHEAFFRQLTEKIASLPGVEAVGVTQSLPFGGDYILAFIIEGRPDPAPGVSQSAHYYSVNPDYFKAMGIPLIKGRLFTDQDRKGSVKVALVNETFAQRYFANEDPIGKRITNDTNDKTNFREIVGIVGDVKQYGLTEEKSLAQTYEPCAQKPFSSSTLAIRSSIDSASMLSAVRGKIYEIDKDQPLAKLTAMEELVSNSISQQRFSMLLLGIFSAVALLLAAVGIYGVMAYSVSQRTHEIGIRMALGAQTRDVLRMIVFQGMALTAIGLIIGLAGAFALTRVMESLLFNVSATDPTTYILIPVLLAGISFIACYIPARRATRVDPMIALRYE